MNNSKVLNVVVGMIGVCFLVALIVFWPMFVVWALNTLFPLLSIPYGFTTWLAVVVLNITTFGGLQATLSKKKE